MTQRLIALLSLALFSLAAGCGSQQASDPRLTEIHRTRSGDIDVVMLATAGALQQTRNYCTVEFRSAADRHLVDVGTVKVRTSMSMEGAPMDGVVTDPKQTAPGRYTVELVLAMSGDWTIAIDWMGPAGPGSANFPAVVR